MLPLVKPYFPPKEALMPELEKIIYSGYVAEGQPVYDFEREFQKYIGNPFLLLFIPALMLSILLLYLQAYDPEMKS